MNLLHKILDKFILSIVKKEITQYEIEKLKAQTITILCAILSITLFILNPCNFKEAFFYNLIAYIVLGFFPMTLLYSYNFIIKLLFKDNGNGTKIGLIASILDNNPFLFFIGFIFDIFIFALLVIVGMVIGLPLSLLNIKKRLQLYSNNTI